MIPFEVRLARTIRAKRAESGLSARALAHNICVNSAQIYDWENGRNAPSARNLCLLADEFHCTVDELMGRGEGNDNR